MKAVNSFTALFKVGLILLYASLNGFAQVADNPSSVSQQTNSLSQTTERYRIGFQDKLQITVYTVLNSVKFDVPVDVEPNGTIRLPALKESVSAVCKTETELSKELTEIYGKNYLRNPYVAVRISEQRSQSFAVIGAVMKPGNFYSNRKMRLLELLAQAGGPDPEKAGTKMIVARLGSRTTCNDNKEVVESDSQNVALYQFKIKDVQQYKEDLLMQPGDVVSVLDADVIYVYGNVNKQGSIKLTRPLTLRQAIASAEGFAPASKKDKIRIIRVKQGTSEWDEIIFNLKDIDTGKVQDPFLLPDDIVAVSEDKVKSIIGNLGKSLTNGIPSIFYRVPVP